MKKQDEADRVRLNVGVGKVVVDEMERVDGGSEQDSFCSRILSH